MPLDTGGVTHLNLRADGDANPAAIESYMPTIDAGPDVGAALKAAREFRGLTLQDVADATRIRRSYLSAIEEMRLEELPARPFTIGYIRAYANALGLDGEQAVERFKSDEPVADEPLREPVGVHKDGDPRLGIMTMAAALIIGAIVLWNVAQRAMSDNAPPPPTAPEAVAVTQTPPPAEGPVSLGAPLPAPVESTTPAPYETPGLEAATAAGGSSDAVEAAKHLAAQAKAEAAAESEQALPPTFTPNGAIYGAPAKASNVTLQAHKAGSLIVRGADGSVYFARQLSVGEAYRVPMLGGLTVDVSDPHAFQVFVGGQSKGYLPAPQTPVGKLAG